MNTLTTARRAPLYEIYDTLGALGYFYHEYDFNKFLKEFVKDAPYGWVWATTLTPKDTTVTEQETTNLVLNAVGISKTDMANYAVNKDFGIKLSNGELYDCSNSELNDDLTKSIAIMYVCEHQAELNVKLKDNDVYTTTIVK